MVLHWSSTRQCAKGRTQGQWHGARAFCGRAPAAGGHEMMGGGPAAGGGVCMGWAVVVVGGWVGGWVAPPTRARRRTWSCTRATYQAVPRLAAMEMPRKRTAINCGTRARAASAEHRSVQRRGKAGLEAGGPPVAVHTARHGVCHALHHKQPPPHAKLPCAGFGRCVWWWWWWWCVCVGGGTRDTHQLKHQKLSFFFTLLEFFKELADFPGVQISVAVPVDGRAAQEQRTVQHVCARTQQRR